MNTRKCYATQARSPLGGVQRSPLARGRGPYGLGTSAASLQQRPAVPDVATLAHPACPTLPGRGCRHPLTAHAENERLARSEDSVKRRFDAIVPMLKELAALPRGTDFAERAQELARTRLGLELPQALLADAWVAGPDIRTLYAHCVFGALDAGAEQFRRELEASGDAVQDTSNFFLDCGFHVVDISPCSDGRLKGLMPYILRMPMSSFSRRTAYAGALFNIEGDVQNWVRTELRRFREGVPSTAGDGTRYLKIAVYHGSSSDPHHKGCAAHGSNDHVAMEAALERLLQFREAIENAFCCGASTDILLIGVDTDTDAIRVHVPDANGDLSVYRYVDNARVYHDTLNLDADRARLAVHDAIRGAGAAEGWGRGEGEPHEGMRRLIATLLINNLSQIEYVADQHGGRYPDLGHAERYVSIGDGFEEVQIRNLAYYARLDTLEEGIVDVDVGIKIFKGLNVRQGLPIPVAIHYRYDACVPGARERTVSKCRRVRAAIEGRYPQLVEQGLLRFSLSVQDQPTGSPIEEVNAS